VVRGWGGGGAGRRARQKSNNRRATTEGRAVRAPLKSQAHGSLISTRPQTSQQVLARYCSWAVPEQLTGQLTWHSEAADAEGCQAAPSTFNTISEHSRRSYAGLGQRSGGSPRVSLWTPFCSWACNQRTRSMAMAWSACASVNHLWRAAAAEVGGAGWCQASALGAPQSPGCLMYHCAALCYLERDAMVSHMPLLLVHACTTADPHVLHCLQPPLPCLPLQLCFKLRLALQRWKCSPVVSYAWKIGRRCSPHMC